jgi:hypothetical protein
MRLQLFLFLISSTYGIYQIVADVPLSDPLAQCQQALANAQAELDFCEDQLDDCRMDVHFCAEEVNNLKLQLRNQDSMNQRIESQANLITTLRSRIFELEHPNLCTGSFGRGHRGPNEEFRKKRELTNPCKNRDKKTTTSKDILGGLSLHDFLIQKKERQNAEAQKSGTQKPVDADLKYLEALEVNRKLEPEVIFM